VIWTLIEESSAQELDWTSKGGEIAEGISKARKGLLGSSVGIAFRLRMALKNEEDAEECQATLLAAVQ